MTMMTMMNTTTRMMMSINFECIEGPRKGFVKNDETKNVIAFKH